MTAPYRDEVAALEARHEALEAEVAERARARDEAARMLAEVRGRVGDQERAAAYVARVEQRRVRMKVLAVSAFAISLAVSAGARIASSERRDQPTKAMLVERYQGLADKLCRCASEACVDEAQRGARQVREDLWHVDSGESDVDLDRRIVTIGQRYDDCLAPRIQGDQAIRSGISIGP